MLQLTAEIRPSNILAFVFGVALAVAAIALVIGLIYYLLFDPLIALVARRKISDETATLWFWILVGRALFGLLYWQFS